MGSKRDSPVNVLLEWLRKRSMKVKIFLGIMLAFCALVALTFTIREPNFSSKPLKGPYCWLYCPHIQALCSQELFW